MIDRAAIRYKGTIYSQHRPARHHDIIRYMHQQGFGPECMHEQGFVTTDGRFVNRREAAALVDQPLKWPPLLYSEDLW
ncbi:hypothetical protein ACUN0C_18985 [Faunimonas sp. B44]|uniref:hypothetical protein n=1 Tax=Faunimonas sp. B44 TaxID=3461493 RepID=UPI004043B11F